MTRILTVSRRKLFTWKRRREEEGRREEQKSQFELLLHLSSTISALLK